MRRSRFRPRMSSPRNVVQSFKKVIDYAGASHAAGAQVNRNITFGVDAISGKQTTATDVDVPTGSMVKFLDIMWSAYNAVNIITFVDLSIQLIRSNQSSISPDAVGGNSQRNQVFHQDMLNIGQLQSTNRKYRFKIPRKYQRVREGDIWVFNFKADQIISTKTKIIYKFYR